MTRTPRLRRPAPLVAAVSAAALLGALLPVALAPTAVAANGCLTEQVTGQGTGIGGIFQPGERCDDQVPPRAEVVGVTPVPNGAGYVNTKSLTFTYTGRHTDEDTDPIGLECKFWPTADSPGEPKDWTDCGTAGAEPLTITYENLADTTTVPYTFKVRAIDTADDAITATDPPAPANPINQGQGAETDLPDVEDGFDAAIAKIDTRAPQSYIFNTPYDAETPELPMLDTDSPTFRLAASEGNVTFQCTIDDRVFPCSTGNTTFPKLTPGTKTLSVGTTDQAGNVDPDPATTQFTVPADIPRPDGTKWTESASPKAFGGSFIETTQFGAKFSVTGTNVREVRLICTKRPDAGILKYQTPGNPNWAKVKLNSKTIQRGAVVILRNASSQSFTGTMKFQTYSRGKLVSVDAIMMR